MSGSTSDRASVRNRWRTISVVFVAAIMVVSMAAMGVGAIGGVGAQTVDTDDEDDLAAYELEFAGGDGPYGFGSPVPTDQTLGEAFDDTPSGIAYEYDDDADEWEEIGDDFDDTSITPLEGYALTGVDETVSATIEVPAGDPPQAVDRDISDGFNVITPTRQATVDPSDVPAFESSAEIRQVLNAFEEPSVSPGYEDDFVNTRASPGNFDEVNPFAAYWVSASDGVVESAVPTGASQADADAALEVDNPNFEVTVSLDTSPVAAGDDIEVDYTIENTGFRTDTQDIGFIVNESFEAAETVTLDPGETGNGTFTYTTDSDDAPEVELIVTSDDTAAGAVVPVTANLEIEDFSDELPDGEVAPADLEDVEVTVSETTGVEAEDAGAAIQVVNGSGDEVAFESLDEDDFVNIAGGEDETFTFFENGQDGLGVDTYSVIVFTDAGNAELVESTENFTIAEPANFQVNSVTPQDDDATEGDSVDVEIEVENTGGVEETQTVELTTKDTDGEFTVVEDSEEITLDAEDDGATQTVKLTYESESGDAPEVDVEGATEDDSQQATITLDIEPGKNEVVNVNTSERFDSDTAIQTAIDADNTESGHTLLVGPGTYEESVTVDVEGLTLEGPNADIAGDSDERGAEASFEIGGTITADEVTIDGFELTGADDFIELEGDSTVIQNTVASVEDSAVVRFQDGSDGTVITQNKFTEQRGGNFILNARQNPEDDEIDGVEITDNTFVDIENGGVTGIQAAGFTNAEISGNDFEDMDGDAIRLAANVDGTEVTDNTFENYAQDAGFPEGVLAGAIVANDAEGDVDVTDNVFEDAGGDDVYVIEGGGDVLDFEEIADNNDFDQNVVAAENSVVPEPGEDEILNLDTGERFDDVDEAINSAGEDETLRFGPSNDGYEISEDINPDQDELTLEGPNAGLAGDSDDRGDEAVLQFQTRLDIDADDVTFAGFEFEDEIDGNAYFRPTKSSDVDAEGFTLQNNIFADGNQVSNGDGDGFTVSQNLFDGAGSGWVVQADGGENVEYTDNVFEDIGSTGIQIDGPGGEASGNVFDGVTEDAIRLTGDLTDAEITDNTIRNTGDDPADASTELLAGIVVNHDTGTPDISDNTFEENTFSVVFFTDTGASVEDNVFEDPTDDHTTSELERQPAYVVDFTEEINLDGILEDNTFDPNVVTVADDDELKAGIFPTIEAAVDAADTGDTVAVGPGTYEESVDIGTEGLTLEAADGASPTVDGQGEIPVLVDGADDVTVDDENINFESGIDVGADFSNYNPGIDESDADAIVTSDATEDDEYESIGAALDEEGADTTVLVKSDYDASNENSDNAGSSSALISIVHENVEVISEEGPEATVIDERPDAEGDGRVVDINAANVVFQGFDVADAAQEGIVVTGVVEAEEIEITDNKVTSSNDGILVSEYGPEGFESASTDGILIKNNEVEHKRLGISLSDGAENPVVEQNTIIGDESDNGIQISGDVNNAIVEANLVETNNNGLLAEGGKVDSLTNNHFIDNEQLAVGNLAEDELDATENWFGTEDRQTIRDDNPEDDFSNTQVNDGVNIDPFAGAPIDPDADED